MLNTIKKHWFIVLVGVLFVAATVYFAYDMTKGFLPGKNVSGKDVVFEINGQNVTADDLYERLFDDLGNSALYTLFERAVVAQSFTADKDMISQAKIQAESTIENFKSYYGETAI
jgi:foldase protein PrsA